MTDRSDHDHTRPPSQARAPGAAEGTDDTTRDTDPTADRTASAREGSAGEDEPRRIDKGTPSFADTNVAADQRRQGRERGAGLGAGGTDNRAARYGTPDREVPEDDMD